jgi:tripartite-type tricarboxylate transporter receptor subunit TctC
MLTRRSFMQVAGASVLLPMAGALRAQAFPDKPVRIILGLAPGASTDAGTRMLAQALGEISGQTFIVENRPGAGSTIAASIVAGSTPDGYTQFMGTGSYATSAALYKSLPFDPEKSFKPITQLNRFPSAIAVSAKSGITSLEQLIEQAKRAPGSISYASTGYGGQTHFAGELFQMITGTKMVHVPYKGGGPAMQDVLAGRVPVIFVDLFTLIQYAKGNALKVLAVTGAKRADIAPTIPTAVELGVTGFEITAWLGLFAPAGTPDNIVRSMQRLVADVCKRPAFIKRMGDSGAELVGSTSAEFTAFFHREIDLYKRIATTASIHLD